MRPAKAAMRAGRRVQGLGRPRSTAPRTGPGLEIWFGGTVLSCALGQGAEEILFVRDEPAPKPPGVGDPAPDFRLVNGKGSDGRATFFQLSEACRKGPVIVAFFPGAFTATCTKELCSFSDHWAAYESLGAQFVGVSVDSWRVLDAFAKANKVRLGFASDFERTTINRWGLVWDSWWGPCSRRATFVVDRRGTVRYARVEEDADREPDYAAIQAALRALG